MYIASVSKTVSALTMMRTLQLAGVSLDASIDPYLPSYWTRGSNIAQVTFRHLMSHRSGLDVGPDGSNPGATTGSVTGQGIQALRNVIAAGVDVDNMLDEGASTPYVNANFGLLRVLAPMVLFGEAYHTGQMDVAKTNEDEVFSASFSELASVLVLEPTGMAPTACGPRETAGKQTMYYNINNASSADLLNHAIDGNPQRVCGATGFHLSAIELGGILAHLRYTDHIINASMRSQMNASSLGWLNPVRFGPQLDGEFGSYRAHGGDSSASNTAAGVATCMMDYPINVQAVLLLNSRGGPTGAAVCALLRDAYDASWTAP
jgi:CubicO group peptidase (beta-lactamase class C family)